MVDIVLWRRLLCFVLGFVLFIPCAAAVPVENSSWNLSFNYMVCSTREDIRDMDIDVNGSLYVAGNIANGLGYRNFHLKKYSSDAVELWNFTYDGNYRDDNATGLVVAPDGNIYASLTHYKLGTQWDWFLLKFSPNGSLLWNRSVGTSGRDEVFDVAVDSQNNLYAIGYGHDLVDQFSNADIWIKKFFPNGTEDFSWNITYDIRTSPYLYPHEFSLALDGDDNVFAAVYGYNLVGVTYDDWLIKKFFPNGTEDMSWNLSFSSQSTRYDFPYDIAVNQDGDVYVVGTGFNLVSSSPMSKDDWWIKKFFTNATEDKNWNMSFDNPASAANNVPFSVGISDTGIVYVAGYVNGVVGAGSADDWWIKKFYPNGTEDENWNLSFSTSTTGSISETVYSVVVDNESLYAGGFGFGLVSPTSWYDWWIKKFDEVSLTNPSITVTKTDITDPVTENSLLNYSINITNIGNAMAVNVTLNESYPQNVTFVSAIPMPNASNSSWILGNLSINESLVINITVLVDDDLQNGTLLDNNVTVFYYNSTDTVNVTANENTTYYLPLGSQLEIWDQADSRGGSSKTYSSENTSFYANYTDSVGVSINGTGNSCNISFNVTDGSFLMDFNATSFLYDYKTNLSEGNVSYNVSCISLSYENQIADDDVFVNGKCITLNSPIGNEEDMGSNFTLNCTVLQGSYDLKNVTFYHNYNGSFIAKDTIVVTQSGDVLSNITISNYTYEDTTVTWNCLVCDENSCEFAETNATFSGWDLGTYNYTVYNYSILLESDDNEQELPENGTNDGFINMTGNVLLLHLNEESGILIDYSGESNNATESGGIPYNVTGKLNTALGFRAWGDFLYLSDNLVLGPSGTFTWSTWFKGAKQNGTLFSEYESNKETQDNNFIRLQLRPDNGSIRVQQRGDGGLAARTAQANISNWNIWHHAAVVYTNDTLYLYLDGELMDSNNDSISGSYSANVTYFGRYCFDGICYGAPNSTIDEIAIWNRTLSSDEISAIYERQEGKYISEGYYTSKIINVGENVIWNNISWENSTYGRLEFGEKDSDNTTANILLMHMNEASGPIIDSSGRGHNGTYNGASYGMTGMFSTALGFDGVDDYVDVPFDETLSNTVIEMWIKPDFASTYENKTLNRLFVMRENDTTILASYNNLNDKFTLTNRNDSWIQTGFGYSTTANVSSLLESSDGTLYAGTGGMYAHVFRSDNGGINWTQNGSLGSSATKNVHALLESSDGTLYAGTGGMYAHVFRSDNGGINWTQNGSLGSSATKNVHALLESSDGTLYAGTGGTYAHVFRSDNGGINWTQNGSLGPSITKKTHALLESSDGTLYAGTGGMYGRVFKSNNSGINWTQTGSLGVSTTTDVYSLLESSDGTLYAGTGGMYGRVFKSNNSGFNWTQTGSLGISTIKYVHTLLESGDGTLYAGTGGTYGRMFRSNDNGTTWNQTGRLGSSPITDTKTLLESSDGILYAGVGGMYGRVFKSDGNVLTTDTVEFNAGEWLFLSFELGDSGKKIYINGIQNASNSYSFGEISSDRLLLGGDFYSQEGDGGYRVGRRNTFFSGTMDEVTIFNDTLSSSEILDHYDRETYKLNLTVRSCDDSSCAGETFTDVEDTSPQNLSVSNNQYFQYKFYFETEDTNSSPEILANSVIVNYGYLNSPPVINSVNVYPTPYLGGIVYIEANVTDSDLDYVNFTVFADNIVFDNVQGTNKSELWNSTFFILNESRTYNYSILAVDSEGDTTIENGSFDFALISLDVDPSSAESFQDIQLSGYANYTNGTAIPNNTISVYVNGALNNEWLDNWGYKKQIDITSSIDILNFQLNISLNTSALVDAQKLQSGCEDLRFVENGKILGHHIIGCNETTTNVSILINLSSSGNTVDMYYGNPSAPSVNSTLIYDFYDDFESGTFDNWDSHTSNWIIDSAQKYEGAYSAKGQGTGRGDLVSNVSYTNATFEGWFRFAETDQWHYPFIPLDDSNNSMYSVAAMNDGHFGYYNGTAYYNFEVDKTYSADTWYKIRMDFDYSVDKYWVTIDDELLTPSGLLLKNSGGNISNNITQLRIVNTDSVGSGTTWADNVVVRKYISTQSSVSFGEESLPLKTNDLGFYNYTMNGVDVGDYVISVNLTHNTYYAENNDTLSVTRSPVRDLDCFVNNSLGCSGDYTDILHLSNFSDAHAELVNMSGYNYTICCKDKSGTDKILNYTGYNFLRLSNVTDAHVELPEVFNYTYDAYIGSSGRGITCTFPKSNGSCSGEEMCLATVSTGITNSTSNLHIADCTTDPYETSICCRFEDTDLDIWDSGDQRFLGYRLHEINDTVMFYANYTDLVNVSSVSVISDANCTLIINSTNTSSMVFNSTYNIYVSNFSFDHTGRFHYNVSCRHSLFDESNVSDYVDIYAGSLYVNKTGTTAYPDKVMNYSILIRNMGNLTAYNVSLNESFDPNVIYVNATLQPLNDNHTWLIGNLSANESYVLNISVLVNTTAGTIIHNEVNVSWNYPEGYNYSVIAAYDTNVTVPPVPIIALLTSNSSLAYSHRNNTFYFNVTNSSNSSAFCTLYLDSVPYGSASVTVNAEAEITQNGSVNAELVSYFNVSCDDGGGVVAWSESRKVTFVDAVFLDDMEFANPADEGDWGVGASTGTSNWTVDHSISYDGSNSSYSDSLGLYEGLEEVHLYVPLINLTNYEEANISFRVKYDIEPNGLDCYDALMYEVSIDNVTYSPINPQEDLLGIISSAFGNPRGGENGICGVQNFSFEWINLSKYTGGEVYFKFTLATDSANEHDGLYLDNLVVRGIEGNLSDAWIILNKTDNIDPVQSGQLLNYQILVSNTGNRTAKNISITEVYDVNVEFYNATPAPNVSDNYWLIGDLLKGENTTISVIVNVSASNGTVLFNNVSALYHNQTHEIYSYANESTLVLAPLSGAYLNVTKTESHDPVANGSTLNYTINIVNIGNQSALNITINETYPENVTFVDAQPLPNVSNNVWYADEVNGSMQINVTVSVNASDGDVLFNNVNYEYYNGSTFVNGSVEENTTVYIPITSAFLTLNKTDDPDPVVNNSVLTYTLNVTNIGLNTAVNVTLTEFYPENVSFISAVPSPNVSDNIWNIGNLSSDGEFTINISVLVNASVGDVLFNKFNATYYNGTAHVSVEANESTTVYLPSESAIITVVKSDSPDPVANGTVLNYTITLNNSGSLGANATVNETYPENVSFVSAVPSPNVSDNVWYLTNITGGVIINISVLVDANEADVLHNLVNITYNNGSNDVHTFADANTTVFVPIQSAILTAVKTDDPDPVANNSVLTYTLNVTNTGLNTAVNVTLTEFYPENVSFISAVPSPNVSDNIWNIGNLSSDGEFTINISVLVNASVGDVLFNKFNATYYNGTAHVSAEANESTTVYLPSESAIITAVKSDSPDPVANGTVLNYTITLNNSGSLGANATVNETYPENVSFVSAVPSPNVSDNVWYLTNVTGIASINISVLVDANEADVLHNLVNITYNDGSNDVHTFADANTTVFIPIQSAILTAVKTDDPDPVANNSVLTYTLNVTNIGLNTAVNVTLTEFYPENVSFISAVPSPNVSDNIWNIGNLSPSAEFTINISVLVNASVGDVLFNKFNATYYNGTAHVSVEANESTTVYLPSESAIITVVKSDSPDPVANGTVLNYTITLNNSGSLGANATVNETYPENVSFVSAVPSPNVSDNVWYLTNVTGIASINISVLVDANEADVLHNLVNITYNNGSNDVHTFADANTTVFIPIQSAVLTAVKTDDPDPVVNNSVLTYTLNVTNIGLNTAVNVTLTEFYPENVSFISAVPSPNVSDNIWNIGNLSPSAEFTINISVLVNASVGDVLFNKFNATYYNGTAHVSVEANESTTVYLPSESAIITVVKSDSPDPVANGTVLNYTITLNNSGSLGANATVNETYPENVSFVSAVPSPNVSDNVWYLTNITGGVIINISVLVDANEADVLHNLVNITYNNGSNDVHTFADANTTVFIPIQSAILTAVKTDDPDPVVNNSVLTYTLNVTNIGLNTAVNVTLTEFYPENVSFISAVPSPNVSDNIWNIGNLSPSAEFTINISVLVNASVGDVLFNKFNATYYNGTAHVSVEANESTTVYLPSESAIITVVKSDSPDPVANGTVLNYTITLNNSGSLGANATVNETYPENVSFVSAVPSPNVSDNVWYLTNITGGVIINISVLVDANEADVLHNLVNITYNNGSNDVHTFADANTTVFIPIQSAILTAVKTDDPDPVNNGSTVNYTITITNSGLGDAVNVTLTEYYPVRVNYVSSSIAPNVSDNVWYLGNISDNKTLEIEAVVNAGDGDVLFNNASIEYYNGTDFVIIYATQNTTVHVPDVPAVIFVNKTDSVDPIMNGSVMNYTITLRNTANGTAAGVTVTEYYPVGVTFMNATPTPDAGDNIWNFGSMPAADEKNITITVTVQGNDGDILFNNVSVEYNNGSLIVTEYATENTTVRVSALEGIVSVTKSDSVDPVAPSEQYNYSIVLSSTGLGTAQNVSVNETYPANVSFVSAVPAPDVGDNYWYVGNITSGSSTTIVITVQTNATDGSVLLNNVSATYYNGSVFINESAVENTTVFEPPPSFVTVTKTDSPDPVENGSTISYEIRIENTINKTLYNITVEEFFDSDTTYSSSNVTPVSNYVWELGNISALNTISLEVVVKVVPDANNGQDVMNNVSVMYSNGSRLINTSVVENTSVVVSDPSPPQEDEEEERKGGGRSYCEIKWECSEWGVCRADGTRSRTCYDKNLCQEKVNIMQTLLITQREPKPAEEDTCLYMPQCDDAVRNGDESDVDCGGSCGACPNSKACYLDTDCFSKICLHGYCRAIGTLCIRNDDCAAGQICIDKKCIDLDVQPKSEIGELSFVKIMLGWILFVLLAAFVIYGGAAGYDFASYAFWSSASGKKILSRQLYNYILFRLAQGDTHKQITSKLVRVGWSKEIAVVYIAHAIQKPQKPMSDVKKMESVRSSLEKEFERLESKKDVGAVKIKSKPVKGKFSLGFGLMKTLMKTKNTGMAQLQKEHDNIVKEYGIFAPPKRPKR